MIKLIILAILIYVLAQIAGLILANLMINMEEEKNDNSKSR